MLTSYLKKDIDKLPPLVEFFKVGLYGIVFVDHEAEQVFYMLCVGACGRSIDTGNYWELWEIDWSGGDVERIKLFTHVKYHPTVYQLYKLMLKGKE